MSTITPGPFSKEERDRMELLVNELKSNGNYFRLRSNQPPQTVTLDMGFSLSRISRVIDMPDGSRRRISHYSCSIWNHSMGDEGDGGRPSTLYDTNYEFIAAPHIPEDLAKLMHQGYIDAHSPLP